MLEVSFTAPDSCEVLTDAGVLTCYRTNMGPGHGWHAVWLVPPGRGWENRIQMPSYLDPAEEMLAAIREAEGR